MSDDFADWLAHWSDGAVDADLFRARASDDLPAEALLSLGELFGDLKPETQAKLAMLITTTRDGAEQLLRSLFETVTSTYEMAERTLSYRNGRTGQVAAAIEIAFNALDLGLLPPTSWHRVGDQFNRDRTQTIICPTNGDVIGLAIKGMESEDDSVIIINPVLTAANSVQARDSANVLPIADAWGRVVNCPTHPSGHELTEFPLRPGRKHRVSLSLG